MHQFDNLDTICKLKFLEVYSINVSRKCITKLIFEPLRNDCVVSVVYKF